MKQKMNEQLAQFLIDSPLVVSAWLGGSTATGREDELSDTDLVIISPKAPEAFQALEEFIRLLYPIKHQWNFEDTSKYLQRFYVLDHPNETYFIDVVIFDNLDPSHYVEYFNESRHGKPDVIVDKTQILQQASQFINPQKEASQVVDWVNLQGRFEVFYRTFVKEALRGKFIDAHTFYMRIVATYVQAERYLHSPEKYDFQFRYLYVDLPQEISSYVEDLLKVSDLESMKAKALGLKTKMNKFKGFKK